MDNETLNAMVRQEMDERALAAQVQKHGSGHGRDAVSQAVAPGATPQNPQLRNTDNQGLGRTQTGYCKIPSLILMLSFSHAFTLACAARTCRDRISCVAALHATATHFLPSECMPLPLLSCA